MGPDSTQKPGKKDGFSVGDSAISSESDIAQKTSVSGSEGQVSATNLGRGISAFFESLPTLGADLVDLSDSKHGSKTRVFGSNSDPDFSSNFPTGFSSEIPNSIRSESSGDPGASYQPRTKFSALPQKSAPKSDQRSEPGTDWISNRKAGFSHRSKSSLRLRYDAEVLLIKRKIGDLEFVRETLGLTQRKMCQLLLVDPSAWTRWTKKGEDAPPHIYRALQWYLAVQEKYPALDVNFWLSTVARTDESGRRRQEEKMAALGDEFAGLTSEIKRLQEELFSRTSEFSTRMSAMQRKMREVEVQREKLDAAKDPLGLFLEKLGRNPKLFFSVLGGALVLGFLLAAAFLK